MRFTGYMDRPIRRGLLALALLGERRRASLVERHRGRSDRPGAGAAHLAGHLEPGGEVGARVHPPPSPRQPAPKRCLSGPTDVHGDEGIAAGQGLSVAQIAAPDAVAACVAEVLRHAPFPAHDLPDGMTFDYPVTLRF